MLQLTVNSVTMAKLVPAPRRANQRSVSSVTAELRHLPRVRILRLSSVMVARRPSANTACNDDDSFLHIVMKPDFIFITH